MLKQLQQHKVKDDLSFKRETCALSNKLQEEELQLKRARFEAVSIREARDCEERERDREDKAKERKNHVVLELVKQGKSLQMKS